MVRQSWQICVLRCLRAACCISLKLQRLSITLSVTNPDSRQTPKSKTCGLHTNTRWNTQCLSPYACFLLDIPTLKFHNYSLLVCSTVGLILPVTPCSILPLSLLSLWKLVFHLSLPFLPFCISVIHLLLRCLTPPCPFVSSVIHSPCFSLYPAHTHTHLSSSLPIIPRMALSWLFCTRVLQTLKTSLQNRRKGIFVGGDSACSNFWDAKQHKSIKRLHFITYKCYIYSFKVIRSHERHILK